MLFRKPPTNPVDQLKTFLQLSSSLDFKFKENLLESTLLTKERALIEYNIIRTQLEAIESDKAVCIISNLNIITPKEVAILRDEINLLDFEVCNHPYSNRENYQIALDAKHQELNKLTYARVVIIMSRIKNLDKLVFVSTAHEKEQTACTEEQRLPSYQRR